MYKSGSVGGWGESKLLLGAWGTTRRKRISANALKGFFCVLLIDLYQARVAFRINGFGSHLGAHLSVASMFFKIISMTLNEQVMIICFEKSKFILIFSTKFYFFNALETKIGT